MKMKQTADLAELMRLLGTKWLYELKAYAKALKGMGLLTGPVARVRKKEDSELFNLQRRVAVGIAALVDEVDKEGYTIKEFLEGGIVDSKGYNKDGSEIFETQYIKSEGRHYEVQKYLDENSIYFRGFDESMTEACAIAYEDAVIAEDEDALEIMEEEGWDVEHRDYMNNDYMYCGAAQDYKTHEDQEKESHYTPRERSEQECNVDTEREKSVNAVVDAATGPRLFYKNKNGKMVYSYGTRELIRVAKMNKLNVARFIIRDQNKAIGKVPGLGNHIQRGKKASKVYREYKKQNQELNQRVYKGRGKIRVVIARGKATNDPREKEMLRIEYSKLEGWGKKLKRDLATLLLETKVALTHYGKSSMAEWISRQ